MRRLLVYLRIVVLILLIGLVAGFWMATESSAEAKWLGVIALLGVGVLEMLKPRRTRRYR